MANRILLLPLLVLAIGMMVMVPAYADTPLQQHKAGVHINMIECMDDTKILMQSPAGRPACVTVQTSEKLADRGYVTVLSEKEPDSVETPKTASFEGADPPPQPPPPVHDGVSNDTVNESPEAGAESQFIEVMVTSPVEFVDDGREIKRSMQRSAPPWYMYDIIMNSTMSPSDINAQGAVGFSASSHEKYSVNPRVGFYPEDWLPTHIPDGQKLLYADTGCYPSGDCYLKMQFVPTSFVLYGNVSDHVLKASKGFEVNVEYKVNQVGEVEDTIEFINEVFESQPGQYGGFVDMTRDGKTVFAHHGGTALNHYRASISFNFNEHTNAGVISFYHTLDELIPIFNSIGN